MVQLTVLGSGGWEGIPAPFCRCAICAQAGSPGFERDERTRPSFLINGPTGRFLLDAGFDLRLQSARFKLPPVADFVISHWHPDHMWGLFELGFWTEGTMGGGVQVHGSRLTLEFARRYFSHIPFRYRELAPFEPFELHGVTVTPFPVLHMRTHDTTDPPDSRHNVFGFHLQSGDFRAAYLADYYDIPSESRALISGADLIIADGTYLFEEISPDAPGSHLLRADSTHRHGGAVRELAHSLGAGRIIYHSITHLSGRNHVELSALLSPNESLAWDGMVVNLSAGAPVG